MKEILFILLSIPILSFGQNHPEWNLRPFYVQFQNGYSGQYQDHKTVSLQKFTNNYFKMALDGSWNGSVYVCDKSGKSIKEIEFKLIKVSVTEKDDWVEYKGETEDNCLIFFRYHFSKLEEITYFYEPNDLSVYFYLKGISKYFITN